MNNFTAISEARRQWLGAASVVLLASLLGAPGRVAHAQSTAPKPNRVVFQVSDADPGKWNLALNNAKNVQAEFGADKVDVEIVAYGPGIGMLKAGAPVADRIAMAIEGGVHVAACQNTMRGMKLTVADMQPDLHYVPSGVGELVKKQQQGWAYVRP